MFCYRKKEMKNARSFFKTDEKQGSPPECPPQVPNFTSITTKLFPLN
jgi:hypothetical protein